MEAAAVLVVVKLVDKLIDKGLIKLDQIKTKKALSKAIQEIISDSEIPSEIDDLAVQATKKLGPTSGEARFLNSLKESSKKTTAKKAAKSASKKRSAKKQKTAKTTRKSKIKSSRKRG